MLENIGLAKKFIQVFHKRLWENPNELFGQPNILALRLTCVGKSPRDFNRKIHLTPRTRLQFSVYRKRLLYVMKALVQKPLLSQLYCLFVLEQKGWLF